MEMHHRVVHRRRDTITALPLYHSGYLLKKNTGEEDFKKYYGELRGSTVFLYTDNTQLTYTERLDLEKVKSMDFGSPHQRNTPTIFTLALHEQEVQLKFKNETTDTGEEWRGFILTVVKKEIPAQLQLLPGQMLRLEDALAQERKRRKAPQSRPPLPPRPSFLLPAPPSPSTCPSPSPSPSTTTCPSPSPSPCPSPSPSPPTPRDTCESSYSMIPSCFYDVTRKEAERMLAENPECGSIILRPSTIHNNYALTLRQVTASGPVMKHYRVTSTSSGFVIELDTAVAVSSLDEVLQYCMEQTEYSLHPYMQDQAYNTRIEMSLAPQYFDCSSATKLVPKAQVAPTSTSLQPPNKTAESGYIFPYDQ